MAGDIKVTFGLKYVRKINDIKKEKKMFFTRFWEEGEEKEKVEMDGKSNT